MWYNLFKLILVSLVFVCCISSFQEKKTKSDLSQHIEKVSIGYKNLYLEGEITKKEDYKKENKYGCPKWNLKKEQLLNILTKMRKVEPSEWYSICYIYPCWYEGKVKNEYTEYELTINSASFIILSNKEETLHFVMESDSALFLASCDCCE